MNLAVRVFDPSLSEEWDFFCDRSHQSTFLHSRKFLSYHEDRFKDCSLIIEENEKCVGIFPAALDPNNEELVISHPGSTYGGILHNGSLRGERMISALSLITKFYSNQNKRKLFYKAVPSFYHLTPAQDDLYALFRLGASRYRCDLSCTIDVKYPLPISDRRKRSLKKSHKFGIEIREGSEYFSDFWKILAENLSRKHGASPVHSLLEMKNLNERFPNNIRLISGVLDDQVVAGVVMFSLPRVNHLQYIASSDVGYETSALDAVIHFCIEDTKINGKRWFDFGISTEKNGQYLNEGLYKFKTEFGGAGFVHEFYELNLQE
ncbi:MAG: methicillin resistance protein [Legionella sp.]|nr:MAG: methicillin resistance protein [Legionella sp.]